MSQNVLYKDLLSSQLGIYSGVPQSSVLGHYYFLLM